MSPALQATAFRAASPAEWSLLLAAGSACSGSEKQNRIDPLLAESLSWETVLDLADRHGLVSLLYESLSSVTRDVPTDTLRVLRERHQINLHKSLFLARELIRILNRLQPAGIAVMPYKGLTLAEQMYGDIALRPAGDIDLLIRPGDFCCIKQAVSELGYTPHQQLSEAEERAYLESGYECTFDSDAGRNLLEVQWAVQPRFYAVDVDVNALFQRAVTVSVAGHQMKTPSPEDQLLILSVHAAKHVWGRLIWLCDIARIAQLPDLNWDWITREAGTLGIARILRITLLLANRFLDAPLMPALRADLQEDRQALTLVDDIAAQIVGGQPCDVESLAYFRLIMRLRERGADQVRFLQRLAFTPGPGEWRSVRLPAPLFPLYRLVRLSRLAARIARA